MTEGDAPPSVAATGNVQGSLAVVVGFATLALIADQVGAATGLTARDGMRAALIGRLDVGVAVIVVAASCALYGQFVRQRDGVEPAFVLDFWWRLIVRFIPPLWIVIAVTMLVTDRTELAAEWARHMFLVQTFSYFHIHEALSSLWPLSVLAGVALLVPVLAATASWRATNLHASTVRHGFIAAGCIVGGVAFRIALHEHVLNRPVLQWLPAALDWLGLGIVLALVVDAPRGGSMLRTLRSCATAPGTCWSVAGLLWLLSATELASAPDFEPIGAWPQTIRHVLDGFAAFFVVLPLAAGAGSQRRNGRAARVRAFVGTLAYGTFLWQLPVLLAAQEVLGLPAFGGGFLRLWLLTTVGALGCSWLTHQVIGWSSRAGVVPRMRVQRQRRTSSESPVHPPA